VGAIVLDERKNRLTFWAEYNTSLEFDLTVNSTSVINFEYDIPWDTSVDSLDITIRNLRIANDSILKISGGFFSEFIVLDTAENREALSRTALLGLREAPMKPKWALYSGRWFLDPFSNEPWAPVPEASAYGAVFSFSGLAVGLIRRRKKRRAHSLTVSGVRV